MLTLVSLLGGVAKVMFLFLQLWEPHQVMWLWQGLEELTSRTNKKHPVDCFDIQKASISGRANISPLITTVPFHIPCAILTDNRGCPGSFNHLWLGSDVKNKPMWIGNGDSGNVVVRFLVSYFNSKNLRLKWVLFESKGRRQVAICSILAEFTLAVPLLVVGIPDGFPSQKDGKVQVWSKWGMLSILITLSQTNINNPWNKIIQKKNVISLNHHFEAARLCFRQCGLYSWVPSRSLAVHLSF